MSHSWNPDGTERDDDAAAHAAAQPGGLRAAR